MADRFVASTNRAYQLVLNGYLGSIRTSLDKVLDDLCHQFDLEPEKAFPDLRAAGLEGRRIDLVRRLMPTQPEGVRIDVHDVDVPPGHDSIVATYMFDEGFDPGYMVQRALYDFEDGNYEASDPNEAVDELIGTIDVDLVSELRNECSSEGLTIERLLEWQRLLGEPYLIPAGWVARDLEDDLTALVKKTIAANIRTAFAPCFAEQGVAGGP